MTIHGENETVITTPSPPRDLVLLSRERVIAFCDDGLYLLNQHSEIMSSFGKSPAAPEHWVNQTAKR